MEKNIDVINKALYEHLQWFLTNGCHGAKFDVNNMKKTPSFIKLKMAGINLYGANLRGVNFSGCDLAGAIFVSANLINCIFDDANLTRANFCEAMLMGCSMKNADASSANFQGANLMESDLSEANLQGANLFDTDIHNVNLTGVDLTFSCWPLSYKTFGVTISDDIFEQLVMHLCEVNTNKEEYKQIQESLMPIAKKFKRFNDFLNSF